MNSTTMDSDAEDALCIKRTTGFAKPRADRIHLRCWNCGMKRSNIPRPEYVPPRAFLAETPCPKCCDKLHAFDPGVEYYDVTGEPIPTEELLAAIDNARSGEAL